MISAGTVGLDCIGMRLAIERGMGIEDRCILLCGRNRKSCPISSWSRYMSSVTFGIASNSTKLRFLTGKTVVSLASTFLDMFAKL